MGNVAKVGFCCFGEVNTPYKRLKIKHDEAVEILRPLNAEFNDAGIVVDDSEYKAADAAIDKLKQRDMECLVVCVAGWVPTHAIIRVTDEFRNLPILLWGLCGWKEDNKIVTTADQAGTTAARGAFEDFGYKFKYVYNMIGEEPPIRSIDTFLRAAHTVAMLRHARIGTMGYRDMLLYGTQYEGNSLRADLGVEVEPFEMLEVVQNIEKLSADKISKTVDYVKENWIFEKECDSSIIENGVKYALAIGKKIEERRYDAISLIDVDGMKKLLGFPPAMVFMLLDSLYGVHTIPENDIMGAVTQLMMGYALDSTINYMEYYEFFKTSVLAGVPDFVPAVATEGDVKVLPTAFGLLNASLLNISKVKTGYVTCSRLIFRRGKYFMHVYSGVAKAPPDWEECGWDAPAPVLPSLEIFPDSCSIEEFAQKATCQHTIVSYGDHMELVKDICKLLDIEIL